MRLDKPDFDNIEAFVAEDINAIFRSLFTGSTKVIQGFRVFQDSATLNDNPSASPIFIKVADSAVAHVESTGTPFFYAGADTLSAVQVDLVSNTTNFIELELTTTTSAPDTRAFWDQSASSGDGAEFTQIVDTVRDCTASFTVNNVGFTGGNKAPIAEIILTGAVITSNKDKRNLLFRLNIGQPEDTTNVFPWSGGRTEPNPDRILDANAYLGADKNINTLKDFMDAVMSVLGEIKGKKWFEALGISLSGSFRTAAMSVLAPISSSAKFAWSGTVLSITDDSGGPADADALAALRLLDRTEDLLLTRQDGTGGSTTITIADGEAVFLEIADPIVNTSYTGVGVGATNYKVAARGSIPLDDTTYWLAYREGIKLIVRGLGELEPGETAEVSDNLNENILAAAGLTSETADPDYSATSSGSLSEPNYNTTANEPWIPRISKLTAMLADVQQNYNVEIDPGVIVWDGANVTVTNAQLSIPGTTIGLAPISINDLASTALPDNSAYYVDIDRTTAGSLALVQATLVSLTPSQQRLVVVRRIGTDLLVR